MTIEDASDGVALGKQLLVLQDEQHQMDIEQVRSAAASGGFHTTDSGDGVNFSYSDATLWLHAPLENHSGEPYWLLELAFPHLDDVELYLLDNKSGALINHYRTGDKLPFAERPHAHRHFVFPLTLAPQGSYELYLRIRSEGTLTAPLRLWKPESFAHTSRNAYMAIMLYFGLLLAFFVYNLRIYFSLHDRVYLYYLGYMAALALAMGAWNGLFYEYLWPGSPQWANLASVVGYDLTGLFGAIFSRRFLNSRRHTPLLDQIMKGCAWIFALLVMAAPFGYYYQQISMVTSATGAIFSMVAIISGVHCLRQGQRSARYFLWAWSLLLFATAILGARSFGLMPTNLITLNAMQFGSAIEIVLFSFALAERIGDLRRGKEIAEEAELAAKMKIVELLERTEHELERRVIERTREVTALNIRLKEQEERLKGLALYDALTGLANRTLLNEQLEAALASGEQQGHKVALLLIDLDEFKPINDSYGHEVGDAVLQAIAQRLRETVRNSDTVARLGGDEFVIVLPALSDLARALALGEKVLQAIAQPVVVEGRHLAVSASVGLACAPDDGCDASRLLRQADRAMYQAKRQGRNRLYIASELPPPEYVMESA